MPKEGDQIDVGWTSAAAVVLPEEGAGRKTDERNQRAKVDQGRRVANVEAHEIVNISRRGALKGAAAVAGAVRARRHPGLGSGQDKKIVLSTWGGDYAKLLTKHISIPVLAPQGWQVVNDEAQVTAAQDQDHRGEAAAAGARRTSRR